MNFTYSQVELDYLSKKDKKFKEAIEQIGFIPVGNSSDPFIKVIQSILAPLDNGHELFEKLEKSFEKLTPYTLTKVKEKKLHALKIPQFQVLCIKDFAARVYRNQYDLTQLSSTDGQQLEASLCAIPGLTFEAIEEFNKSPSNNIEPLERENETILKGMRMLYRHRAIDDAKFERYSKRYQPHGQVAALYLSAIANGAIADLTDPQPKNKK